MKKCIADWLEKISAGSMLVGLYQNSVWALIISFGSILYCLYLRRGK